MGDYWKDFSSRWRDSRRDLDDVLRERVFDVSDSDVLEVSLVGLTSEDKARIRQELEKYCRDLLQAWNSFKEEFPKDPEWVLESREQLTSILEAMRSG